MMYMLCNLNCTLTAYNLYFYIYTLFLAIDRANLLEIQYNENLPFHVTKFPRHSVVAQSNLVN